MTELQQERALLPSRVKWAESHPKFTGRKEVIACKSLPWQRWLNCSGKKKMKLSIQFREALIPTTALASYKGGKNVQLLSACLFVGLRHPTTGHVPLPVRLQWDRHRSSGWPCHPEQGHQPHVPPPWPWPRLRQLQSVAEGEPHSSALQEKGWSLSRGSIPSVFSATTCGSMSLCVWVMGKISCLPPFLLCGAAIQSLRLRHVLISQDRDVLQELEGILRIFPLCFLFLSLPSGRIIVFPETE